MALQEVVTVTGQNISRVLTFSIRQGLPLARAMLRAPTGRVTAVDPLPDRVLERAYSRRNPMEKATAGQLSRFQSQKEPE